MMPEQSIWGERVAALSAFENWCKAKGHVALPASPATVAAFVAHCEVLGFSQLLNIVSSISAIHTARGFADPTFGPVSAELNRISGIGAPRSWKKEHWPLFKALPYALQLYVIDRDRQANTEVKRAQNEAALLRQQIEGAAA